MDLERYGPWALIVGGSEGIGAGFARKLAADGFKLVLTARKTGPLEELAGELRAGGTEVRILSADMSKPDAVDQVRKVTDDIRNGPVWHCFGSLDRAREQAGVDGRAELIRGVVAPPKK